VTSFNYIIHQGAKSCELLHFHSSVVEVSVLLQCGTISLDNWCPVFQDNLVSSSWVEMFPHQLLNDAYRITFVGTGKSFTNPWQSPKHHTTAKSSDCHHTSQSKKSVISKTFCLRVKT
jgi:hypothetical protein